MREPLFIVSKEDWSLHRKGYQDQMRHQQKIREAIRKNLSDIITEESIIFSKGRQIVKIPVRSLDEFRFRYNFNKSKHVGQGDGKSRVGDVIGIDPTSMGGQGQGAGDMPGEDVYEAAIPFDELEQLVFEELELPNLEEKEKRQLHSRETIFNDVRKHGIMSNIDKKRTILENLKRNALRGVKGIGNISPDDLRFKTWDEKITPHSNAMIIAMMDTSGSMGVSLCEIKL